MHYDTPDIRRFDPVPAQYVRVYPERWSPAGLGMRLEVLGCDWTGKTLAPQDALDGAGKRREGQAVTWMGQRGHPSPVESLSTEMLHPCPPWALPCSPTSDPGP